MNTERMHAHFKGPLITVIAAVLFTGCLTIEEHYTFKQDGSGTMEYVVDMSEMMELLSDIEKLGDGKEKDREGNGDGMDLTGHAAELKKIPGIKKVKVKTEKEGSVQRIMFKFADVAALNKALNQLMPDSTGVQAEFFRWEADTLIRTNNRFASALGQDMSSGPLGGDSVDATGLLQSMKYKYSFTFKDPISSINAAEGVEKERPDDRSVKLDTDWSVIMKDPKALDVRITLAR